MASLQLPLSSSSVFLREQFHCNTGFYTHENILYSTNKKRLVLELLIVNPQGHNVGFISFPKKKGFISFDFLGQQHGIVNLRNLHQENATNTFSPLAFRVSHPNGEKRNFGVLFLRKENLVVLRIYIYIIYMQWEKDRWMLRKKSVLLNLLASGCTHAVSLTHCCSALLLRPLLPFEELAEKLVHRFRAVPNVLLRVLVVLHKIAAKSQGYYSHILLALLVAGCSKLLAIEGIPCSSKRTGKLLS